MLSWFEVLCCRCWGWTSASCGTAWGRGKDSLAGCRRSVWSSAGSAHQPHLTVSAVRRTQSRQLSALRASQPATDHRRARPLVRRSRTGQSRHQRRPVPVSAESDRKVLVAEISAFRRGKPGCGGAPRQPGGTAVRNDSLGCLRRGVATGCVALSGACSVRLSAAWLWGLQCTTHASRLQDSQPAWWVNAFKRLHHSSTYSGRFYNAAGCFYLLSLSSEWRSLCLWWCRAFAGALVGSPAAALDHIPQQQIMLQNAPHPSKLVLPCCVQDVPVLLDALQHYIIRYPVKSNALLTRISLLERYRHSESTTKF